MAEEATSKAFDAVTRHQGPHEKRPSDDMASGTRGGGPVRTLVVVGFASLVGLIVCSGDFLRGYLGHLIWYDDGVHMAAATLFSHGGMPYRDFAFLHPPGVVVLLTPFAVAGRFVGTAVGNEAADCSW